MYTSRMIDETKPSSGGSGTGAVDDVQIKGNSILDDGVANITAGNLKAVVREVAPACTTITASGTTATITANTTYAHKPATAVTYTLVTPASNSVYSGFILMIDTTNTASIAFQTDDSPATSIVLNGNPTIETGKTYTVVGQYNVLSSAWNLWISEYKGA